MDGDCAMEVSVNEYTYNQIEVGQEASFKRVVTSEMMDAFRTLSGDVNPLHCDEDYAIGLGHPDRVVYGMLSASFYSTLAGVYLPGKYCLLLNVDSKFNNPVYIGDELTITGKVSKKTDAFMVVTIKAKIVNQDGKKVSSAVIDAKCLK